MLLTLTLLAIIVQRDVRKDIFMQIYYVLNNTFPYIFFFSPSILLIPLVSLASTFKSSVLTLILYIYI